MGREPADCKWPCAPAQQSRRMTSTSNSKGAFVNCAIKRAETVTNWTAKTMRAGAIVALMTMVTGPALAEEHGDAGGILDELRIGVMDHDANLFGNNEEGGTDVNIEALFDSPDWMDWMGAPRPQFGATINSSGNTSFVYGGLAWDWNFWNPFFVEGSLGLAIHNGETGNVEVGAKELGCRWNFHESASVGINITDNHRVMATVEHISNASACSENEGLTNAGVRYGYRF